MIVRIFSSCSSCPSGATWPNGPQTVAICRSASNLLKPLFGPRAPGEPCSLKQAPQHPDPRRLPISLVTIARGLRRRTASGPMRHLRALRLVSLQQDRRTSALRALPPDRPLQHLRPRAGAMQPLRDCSASRTSGRTARTRAPSRCRGTSTTTTTRCSASSPCTCPW